MQNQKKRSYNFVLLQNLDSKQASYLKDLAKKLYIQGFSKLLQITQEELKQED